MNRRRGTPGRLGSASLALVSVAAVLAAVVVAIGAASAATREPGDFAGFTVAVTSPQTAGKQIMVTITAYDSDHDGDANYSGTKCVTFSGPATSPNGTAPIYPAGSSTCSGSLLSFNSSFKATVPITLFAAQSAAKLTVTDVATSKSGTSGSFVVNPAPLDHFTLSGLNAPAPEVAGTPFSVTVSAFDLYGNVPSAWASTSQCVAFTGPGAIGTYMPSYPDQGTCSSGQSQLSFDASGHAPAQMTLFKAESPTLVVTGGGKTGSIGFVVNPAPLDHFTLSGLNAPAPEVAGTPFSVTVSAFDLYGNVPSAWASTSQCVAFTGPGAIGTYMPSYPDQGTCSSGQSQLSFDASGHAPAQMTLFKAESTTLVVTGGGKTGSISLTVDPATLLPSFEAQPTDTQVSTPTHNYPIYSNVVTQTPVTVVVADMYGNIAPDSTQVQMVAPSGLGGTTSEPTSGGVALFGDLTLAAIGTYKLTAEVGSQTTDSNAFDIVDQLAVCSNVGQCQVGASNSAQSSNTTASSGTGTSFQGLVLETTFIGSQPPTGACGGFTPVNGTTGTSVEVTAGNVSDSQPSLTITFTVTKATLKAAGLNYLQALLLNVCLGAQRYHGLTDPGHAWIGRLGVPATYDPGTGLYWGLVPDWRFWGWPNPNPYISARYIDSSGNLVIVLVKPYPWDGRAYV